MQDNLERILSRIKEVLASGKFTSEREWCRKAGVSESYIGSLRSKQQTGEAKTVKNEQISLLAEAAEVSVDWLMGRAKTPGPVILVEGRSDVEVIIKALGAELAAIDPEPAVLVVKQLRSEFFKDGETLPAEYWPGRLRRLIAEAQGRAKDAHQREPATPVNLTEESPEVRAGRKKPKRL